MVDMDYFVLVIYESTKLMIYRVIGWEKWWVKKEPYAVEIKEGESYYWCACGRSNNQPFCDGSHQGTGIEPVAFQADKSETKYLCGCRKSNTKPFCDGTHNAL